MSEKITTKEQAEKFIDSFDTFLFDCDGVLWTGSKLLPNVCETLELLRSKGKQVLFVTNNSTQSRRAYSKKFEGFGIKVNAEEIFCSAYASALYIANVAKLPKDKKVLVVGEKGIEEELELAGIQHIGGTDPSLNTTDMDDLEAIARDETIGAVLAGLDRHINYRKIGYAQAQLFDKDVLFLATNPDSTFPTHGRLLPGAGTVIQAVATAAGRQPEAFMGKPSQNMMNTIRGTAHFDPKKTVMVGDRLNTDMVFGNEGGLSTLMVLTGVDTEATIQAKDAPVKPKFYADRLGVLYDLLQ